MKDIGKIMLIVGMFIGSGFASGKEIAVFFARFGVYSYIFIPFAFICFFGGIFWILFKGGEGEEKIKSSKTLIFISIIVNLVFTSSMMAGTMMPFKSNIFLFILSILMLLYLCFRAMKKGMKYLTKVNVFLIPLLIIVLIICLSKNVGQDCSMETNNGAYAGFFAILYVLMNLSSSCLVIGKIGCGLSKKKMLFISFMSSLILTILLFGINYVLLTNTNSINFAFPLLEISEGWVYYLMKGVLFVGCLTSVLSIVFVNAKALKNLKKNNVLIFLISVILPMLISLIGFGNIVSYLYPLASILGGVILLFLYFLPYKKR